MPMYHVLEGPTPVESAPETQGTEVCVCVCVCVCVLCVCVCALCVHAYPCILQDYSIDPKLKNTCLYASSR